MSATCRPPGQRSRCRRSRRARSSRSTRLPSGKPSRGQALNEDEGRRRSQGKGLPPRQLSIADELSSLELPRREGVYLVGGTVRDILLGRPGFDIDIAVEGDAIAFAEDIARVGGEVTAHGRFGTAVVRFSDGRHWDVVTARRETYGEPAALPDVEAGTIEEDLARRDFTVNAIAASL